MLSVEFMVEKLKTEIRIFEHKQILRSKRNSICNILKDVFCYDSFGLDFQLMEVTEYFLIGKTNILVKCLSEEIKRCSCNKTKKSENCLNNIFYF